MIRHKNYKKILSAAGLFLLLIFSVKISAQGLNLPEPSGHVNDFAGVISSEDSARISALAKELENKTTAQLAVVTVKTTKPETIETYAVKLFEKWGIGQKGKDNGVLLLVAVEDRYMKIEVGYGLEGAIPDVLAHRIIEENIIPHFKNGDYSKGTLAGSLALLNLIAKEYNVELTNINELMSDVAPQEEESFLVAILPFIIILLFLSGRFFLPLLILTSGRRGHWYGSGGFGGGFGGGGFGGGFGGGMSGGGGAIGRW